jgi:membrane protein DedA with SNARE-associated domain
MEHFLAQHGYLAIAILSFLSAMLIPVGSEIAIIYGGVLATSAGANLAHVHPLNIAVVIVVAAAAEVVGSSVGYLIGLYGGRPLVERLGKYVLLTHRDLDRAEGWFEKRGEPLALFGRFIPLLRSFVSVAAGLGEMAKAKFLVFTVIGCAIWCTALALLGDSLGTTYNHVLKDFSYAGYVAAALAVIAVVGLFAHRLSVRRKEQSAP